MTPAARSAAVSAIQASAPWTRPSPSLPTAVVTTGTLSCRLATILPFTPAP